MGAFRNRVAQIARLTVGCQEVVPIQATDGWIVAERRMCSVVVVEMQVRREPPPALLRTAVRKAISPFS